MLGSLAKGKTVVKGFLQSEDCLNTIECFKKLGVKINIKKNVVYIESQGADAFKEPKETLYVGNSGTTIRLMLGILSGLNFKTTITGDESICRRPMDRVIIPLKQMGANIEAVDNKFAPITVKGGNLKGITYELPVASAQVKSCILLAGLFAKGQTSVIEKSPTRDHTERMFKSFGIPLDIQNGVIILRDTKEINVPGDISSAAFFIAAALIKPESKLILKNIGNNPTRNKIIDVFKQMGGNIKLSNDREFGGEPVCDIEILSSKLKVIKIGGKIIPNIIDEIPIISVTAAFADGITEISDAKELRVKESDRIKTMVSALRAVGVKIEEKEDGMIIYGNAGKTIKGGVIDSHGDHRVAMSLAIASLMSENGIEVKGKECVNTSFPGFFGCLRELG